MCLNPAPPADGITLQVPEQLLEELDAEQLAWLVPGARQEKIAELLRSLPKAMRRQIVPVTDHARLALESVDAGPLPPFHTLARRLDHGAHRHAGQGRRSRRSGAAGSSAAEHPRPRRAQVLAEGRDLAQLRRTAARIARHARRTRRRQLPQLGLSDRCPQCARCCVPA